MTWWRLGALAACVAFASVAAGCDRGDESTPTTTAPPATTDTTPGTSTATVRVYLVRNGVVGPVARTVTTPAVLRGAVEELLKPPSSEEAGWGFTTAIPRDATVLGTSIAGGTATIDLSGAFDDDDGSAGMVLRLAQLVHTATQFAAVERVALRLDGNPIAAFSAEGIELPETMTRADFENQAPAILVESPLPGQAVSAPFTVRGSANTFEATVEWDLRSFDNTRLNSGFTTATCGTGCRGTFSFVVAPIEDGSVTLRLFERSAEDGSVGKLVRVPLSVG